MVEKGPLPVFPQVYSANVGIGLQNLLTFSLNPFVVQSEILKVIPSASPKLLNLNQKHPSKKLIFLNKVLLIMITFLFKMLYSPIFGHITTSII